MSKPDARTAILDIDGTLVDSNYLHVLAWHRAFAASGLEVPAAKLHHHVGMGGDRYVAEVAGKDFDAEHGDAVRDAHSRFYGELIEEVVLLDGARELIAVLADDGFEVVLASSADSDEVDHYLELLDAGDLLSRWTTSADVDSTKPDADLVATALADASAERAMMVGDTPWDAIAAGRVGVRFIGVETGGFSGHELRDAGAAAVYADLPELIAALRRGDSGL
jgi:phosphoglycolate phosphatase-like HAD superfamily hydrolase